MSVISPYFKDKLSVYRVPAFADLGWLEHGFGTRESGIWPDESRLVILKQIHSAIVVEANGQTGDIGDGDALITDQPGLVVGIRTADCVPILLVDTRRRAVAAVHAGWRGTAAEIVIRTIERLIERYGSHPSDIWGAIGPAIGNCCYEVGPDVAQQFGRWLPELVGVNEPAKLDLVAVNRGQLIAAGVLREHIAEGEMCTACDAEQLHSYRRDGQKAGRMLAAIGIRPI